MSRRGRRRPTRRRERRSASRGGPAKVPSRGAPSGAAAESGRQSSRTRVVRLIGLGLLAVVIYLPTLRLGFVWDDVILTTLPAVREWGGLWDLWSSPGTANRQGGVGEDHYWPLTYTTFWIEHKLWGLAPAGYHAVNVLLHTLNTALLWRILARLGTPGAWFAAAVFAVHPVHVEAVAWVIGRKDLLATACCLGAFLVWLGFVAAPKTRSYLAALGLYAAGLLSKGIAVTLPAVLLVEAWWRRGRITAADLRRTAPFVVVGVGLSAVDLAFYARGNLSFDYSILERTRIAAQSLWFYAGKLLWPRDLALLYAHWDFENLLAWGYLAAAVVLVAALVALRGRLGRAPLAGTLMFGVALAPVLGFLDFGYMNVSFAADRYQYLASGAGIALVVGAVASGLRRVPDAAKRAAVGAVSLILVLLGAATWMQTGFYRDDATLFEHAAATNRDSVSAHAFAGQTAMEAERWGDAEKHFSAAIELQPADLASRHNVAESQRRRGLNEEALRSYESVLALDPDYAASHAGMGVALAAMERREEAVAAFRRSLSLAPGAPSAPGQRFLLARLLTGLDRADEAAAEYEQILDADPDNAQAQRLLGAIRFAQERYPEALDLFEAVVESHPELAQDQVNVGATLYLLGRLDEAILRYENAVALDPEDESASALLSRLREEAGR